MGVFQIAFLLINLAVPYWIWTSSSLVTTDPIKWKALELTIHRLLDAAGGLTCPNTSITRELLAVCDRSQEGLKQRTSTIFEQVIGNVIYSCDVRMDSVIVKMALFEDAEKDSGCRARDTHGTLKIAPAFVLTFA